MFIFAPMHVYVYISHGHIRTHTHVSEASAETLVVYQSAKGVGATETVLAETVLAE